MITAEMETLKELLQNHNLEMLKIRKVDCEVNRNASKVFLKAKQKYVYVDYGDGNYNSGKWLIDANNNVWTIKAYGQKNRIIGTTQEVISKLQEDLTNIQEALKRKEETGNYGALAVNY